MVKDHPDVVTVVKYGKTYESRDISLLKVNKVSDHKLAYAKRILMHTDV